MINITIKNVNMKSMDNDVKWKVTQLPFLKSLGKKYFKTILKSKKIEIHEKIHNEYCTYNRYEKKLKIDNIKDLSMSVFRYYLYKINPDTNSPDHILKSEAFELEKLISGEEESNKRLYTLITASTQSGKTFLIIALCNILLTLDYTTCFIVKSIAQRRQLENRYNNDVEELREFLLKEGFRTKDINMFNKGVIFDSKSPNKFINTINKNRNRTIICIHHHTHIKRTFENLKEREDLKFALFIDEAHKLGGYKKLLDSNVEDDVLHDINNKYECNLSTLKTLCNKIFLITATPQDILLTDPNLYSKGVVYMPEGSNYRGIKNWHFNIIEETVDKNTVEIYIDKYNNHIPIPESLIKLLYRLSKTLPIHRIDKFGKENYHPVNLLVRYELVNIKQRMILDAFKNDVKPINDLHKCIIDSNWVLITYNQEGIRLYHNSLIGETIELSNPDQDNDIISFHDKEKRGEFIFKNYEIGEIWHWLATNGGSKRFPRILTIAYNNSGEGITFSSTYTNVKETDANWHLTHGYIRLGTTASSANVEQAMGRMNGNFGDNMSPPEITTTQKEKERCIKGYTQHKKWIKDISLVCAQDKDIRIIDFIKDKPVYKNRIPKNFSSIPKAHNLLTKIPNPNKKIEDDSLKLNDVIKTLEVFDPYTFELDSTKRETLIDNYMHNINNDKNINKLHNILTNKKHTKIGIFLSMIEPENIYKKSHILELLRSSNYEQPNSIFTSITNVSSTWGPGCIFKHIDNNNWKIIDEIKICWRT